MRRIAYVSLAITASIILLVGKAWAPPPGGSPPGSLVARLAALQSDVAALKTAVSTLETAVAKLKAENSARQIEIAALQTALAAEEKAREDTDDDLKAKIDGLKTGLDDEKAARLAADAALQSSLSAETAALNTRVLDLENNSVIALDGKLTLDSTSGFDTALFNGVKVQVGSGTEGGIIEATAAGLTINSEGDLSLDAGKNLNTIAINTNIDSFVKTTLDSTQAEIKAGGEMIVKGSVIRLN